jgi:hypothetical protein
MTNETPPPGELTLLDNSTILKTFDAGFKRLPHMFEGMDKVIHDEFPFPTPLAIIGRRIFQKISRGATEPSPQPIRLDPITGIKQKNDSDCVGAAIMSAFSEITGIPVTDDLYEGFLQTTLRHNLAEQNGEGIQVLLTAFNVFSTKEFKQRFPSSEATVALKKGLSLNRVSEIVKTTSDKKNPSYKLFAFLPFESWAHEEGSHMVSLQEIGLTETRVYDPNLGEQRTLPNDEFNRKWQHANKSALFLFVKTT